MYLKKYYLFLLVIFSVIISIPEHIRAQKCLSTNTTFDTGEELTYVISYNWFIVWTEVGDIKLTIEDSNYKGIPTYKVLGLGNTYDNWDWFFKVRDTYQCEIDKQTMKPLYFRRDIQEGSYIQYETYDFNPDKKTAVSERKVKQNPVKTSTINIDECVFDVLSAFMFARNLEFTKYKKGDIIPVSVILDQDIYNIYFRYIGIEKIKVKYAGEFECIKFSLLLIEGALFNEGENLVVWVTNDKNHLPVYIESPIIIGNVKARISNIKGNRYPFTSFIK